VRRYRFKLESVLKYRTVVEELRLQAFATVQAEMAACDARLAAFRDELTRTAIGRPGCIDLEEIARREAYMDVLRARLAQEESVREGITARLEDARASLVQARQAREAMERLRRHDYADYLRLANKAEQEIIDETATLRHGRRVA